MQVTTYRCCSTADTWNPSRRDERLTELLGVDCRSSAPMAGVQTGRLAVAVSKTEHWALFRVRYCHLKACVMS